MILQIFYVSCRHKAASHIAAGLLSLAAVEFRSVDRYVDAEC